MSALFNNLSRLAFLSGIFAIKKHIIFKTFGKYRYIMLCENNFGRVYPLNTARHALYQKMKKKIGVISGSLVRIIIQSIRNVVLWIIYPISLILIHTDDKTIASFTIK